MANIRGTVNNAPVRFIERSEYEDVIQDGVNAWVDSVEERVEDMETTIDGLPTISEVVGDTDFGTEIVNISDLINDSTTSASTTYSSKKISDELGKKSPSNHTHDGRYYLKSEVDDKISETVTGGKIDLTTYFKKTEANNLKYGEFAGGNNLWDGTRLKGYVSSSTGEIRVNNDSQRTDYIEIPSNTTELYATSDQTTSAWMAFFDSSKKFISGISNGAKNWNTLLTVPSNAKYMIFSLGSDCTEFIVSVGNKAIPYEPYIPSVKTLSDKFEAHNHDDSYYDKTEADNLKFGEVAGGNNLWDGTRLKGYVSDGSGNFVTNNDSQRTDYIEIPSDAKEVYAWSNQTAMAWMAFYDSSKTYISGKSNGAHNWNNLIPVPSGAKYMAFTLSNDCTQFIVSVGNKKMPYEPFVPSLTMLSDKIADHNHDSRYYTESEINAKLSTKANTSHTHSTYCPNTMVSDAYSSAVTYAVGNLCIYNNTLWKCLVSVKGVTPSEGTNWTKVSIASEIENLSKWKFVKSVAGSGVINLPENASEIMLVAKHTNGSAFTTTVCTNALTSSPIDMTVGGNSASQIVAWAISKQNVKLSTWNINNASQINNVTNYVYYR